MVKVLVGFMGAGKSTIAPLVDPFFIDTDERVKDKLGMSIKDFFQQKGESAFRQIESDVLKECLGLGHLISTGGGIVESEKNRQLLVHHAHVIYLKADFETVYARIATDTHHQRPLFLQHSKSALKEIFDRRIALYEEVAHQVVRVDDKSPYEIAEEIR